MHYLSLAAVTWIAGCGGRPASDQPRSADAGDSFSLLLEVRAAPPDLVLTNRDTASIYFTVFEHQMAALVNWRPCREPDTCPSVAPRGERRLALDSIPGYGLDASEAILYWWHLVPAADSGLQPDSVRSIRVPLSPEA